jgi:hypothetical protein
MHYDLSLGTPFKRTAFVIPKALWDKLMREFIIEELQIGKRGLPAELSKVIADLVLEDTTKPASFGRFAAKGTAGSDRGKEGFLDQIFRDLGSPHAKESISVKGITMLLDPTLGIDRGGGSRCRTFDFGRLHLQIE